MDKRRSRLVQCTMYIVRTFISHLVLGGRFKSVVGEGFQRWAHERKRDTQSSFMARWSWTTSFWNGGNYLLHMFYHRYQIPTYFIWPSPTYDTDTPGLQEIIAKTTYTKNIISIIFPIRLSPLIVSSLAARRWQLPHLSVIIYRIVELRVSNDQQPRSHHLKVLKT